MKDKLRILFEKCLKKSQNSSGRKMPRFPHKISDIPGFGELNLIEAIVFLEERLDIGGLVKVIRKPSSPDTPIQDLVEAIRKEILSRISAQ